MMNTTQKIADAAGRLSPDAQRALLELAESLAGQERFFDSLTDAQRADLTRSITEADAGEGIDQSEFDRELDALLARTA